VYGDGQIAEWFGAPLKLNPFIDGEFSGNALMHLYSSINRIYRQRLNSYTYCYVVPAEAIAGTRPPLS